VKAQTCGFHEKPYMKLRQSKLLLYRRDLMRTKLNTGNENLTDADKSIKRDNRA